MSEYSPGQSVLQVLVTQLPDMVAEGGLPPSSALVNILQKSVTYARGLVKTSIFMQNCIEDDMVGRNWQNI